MLTQLPLLCKFDCVSLVADGLGMHVPKGYIYFAMGFSVFVEMINLRVRGSHAKPAKLHNKLPG